MSTGAVVNIWQHSKEWVQAWGTLQILSMVLGAVETLITYRSLAAGNNSISQPRSSHADICWAVRQLRINFPFLLPIPLVLTSPLPYKHTHARHYHHHFPLWPTPPSAPFPDNGVSSERWSVKITTSMCASNCREERAPWQTQYSTCSADRVNFFCWVGLGRDSTWSPFNKKDEENCFLFSVTSYIKTECLSFICLDTKLAKSVIFRHLNQKQCFGVEGAFFWPVWGVDLAE